MKETKLTIIILFLLFSLPISSYSRTRQEILNQASTYTNCQWIVTENNLDDPDGTGIDVRENWPFIKGESYRGEAYAWYGFVNTYNNKNILINSVGWGGDNLDAFKTRQTKNAEKWITGKNDKVNNIPEGYNGYTGVDCSGFITKLFSFVDHLGTRSLLNYQNKIVALPINRGQLKCGDFLDKVGSDEHVVMFNNWIDENKATIIAAQAEQYRSGKMLWRVIGDDVTVNGTESSKTLDVTPTSGYVPYTYFPVFTQVFPTMTQDESAEQGYVQIHFQVVSGTALIADSLVMQVDDNKVNAQFVPSNQNKTAGDIYYTSRFPYTVLPDGQHHTVYLSILNELNLQETTNLQFDVVPSTSKNYISKMELTQGNNNMTYFWVQTDPATRKMAKLHWVDSAHYEQFPPQLEDSERFAINSSADVNITITMKNDIATAPNLSLNYTGNPINYHFFQDTATSYCTMTGSRSIWNATIKRIDILSARNNNWFNSMSGFIIDVPGINPYPQSIYDITDSGSDLNFLASLAISTSDGQGMLYTPKSHAYNQNQIGNYLINNRISKIVIPITGNQIDIFHPLNVTINGFQASPFTNNIPISGGVDTNGNPITPSIEDTNTYYNGWLQVDSTNWVWVGTVDFGDNWQSMENQNYPIKIQCNNLDGTSLYDDNQNIIYDTTPPKFDINSLLVTIISNLLNGTPPSMAFNISDNLSDILSINLKLLDGSGGEIVSYPFRVNWRTGDFYSSNPLDFNPSAPENLGLPFHYDKDKQKLLLDLDKLANLKNIDLKKVLSGAKLDVDLADEAGNKFVNADFNFDEKKFTDAFGVVLEDWAKKLANRIVFVNTYLSEGGIELTVIKEFLHSKGIDLKVVSPLGGDKTMKFDDPAVMDNLRAQINDYVKDEGEKVILLGWGDGQVLVQNYLKKYGAIDKKVLQDLSIGAPRNGVNSFAMTPQSYSIYFMLAPLLKWLDTIPGLNNIMSKITGGQTVTGVVQTAVRNDQAINPLSFISLLLGRQSDALTLQNGSTMMNDLQSFHPEDIGVTSKGVISELWPDMPVPVQVGMSLGVGVLGYAGVYNGVELFSFDSKIYNNIDKEVGDLLGTVIDKAIDEYLAKPLWTETEKALRELSGRIGWDGFIDNMTSHSPLSSGDLQKFMAISAELDSYIGDLESVQKNGLTGTKRG